MTTAPERPRVYRDRSVATPAVTLISRPDGTAYMVPVWCLNEIGVQASARHARQFAQAAACASVLLMRARLAHRRVA